MHRLRGLSLLFCLLPGCAPLDQRSANTPFEDETLERQVFSSIAGLHIGKARVNATSVNRHLLLTGEVPDEASKAKIAQVASSLPNVLGVSNELEITEPRGIASSSTDSLLSSNIKMRFAKKGSLGKIKVVTANGSVFLMGLVNRKEAAAAADVASTTKGVQRVVKVFEYLD